MYDDIFEAWCIEGEMHPYYHLRNCMVCDMIGNHGEVKFRPSQTMYMWDGEGDDPNDDLLLCEKCSEDYKAYMDERWADVYGGYL